MSAAVDLSQWVGRSEERSDWINPNHVAALSATLDRDDAFPQAGEAVAPGLHWTLFPPLARQSELGPDGHAKKGGFLPPVTLPRRMWAGGRLQFHQPLKVGEKVARRSVIERVEEKHGKSGHLVFVTVRHILSAANGPAIEEEHDIVYREAPAADAPPPPPAEKAAAGPWCRQIVPDDVLLFRYSALTFNGHRIHYDRRYVTEVEGYAGLVVHGPLLATMLLDLLRSELPAAKVTRFQFKAVRPTLDLHPFHLNAQPSADGKSVRLWAEDHEGWLTMQASAEID